jgi:hypothetical protein
MLLLMDLMVEVVDMIVEVVVVARDGSGIWR